MITPTTLTQKFTPKKPWLKGGLIGIAICTTLLFFYPIIYFPMVSYYSESSSSDTALLPTIITGHFFVFLSPLLVEESSITNRICTERENHCTAWSLEYEAGGIPWTDPEGGAGYCLQQESTPLSSCTDHVQQAAAITLAILLEGIYFLIGAGIATLVRRRK